MQTGDGMELLQKRAYTRNDIVALLSIQDPETLESLFLQADVVRREQVGDEIHIRGIIETSNHCSCNCLYCGLQAGNKDLERYCMTVDEVVQRAVRIAELPVGTIVLQSGESTPHTVSEIEEIIRRIKDAADVAITLSLGQQRDETYRTWFEAGADRYLLKHETANEELFHRLKPDTDLAERLRCLRSLKSIGYQIGTGNMIGLPGQTTGDIADDILLCRELDADMCSFGPFIPSPHTALANAASGTAAQTLQTLAVARIVLKNVHIPANTALGTIDPDARFRSFSCGTNVLMPNFTPLRYRRNYQIYPKRIPEREDIRQTFENARSLILSLGRVPGLLKGHSMKRSWKPGFE